MRSPALLRLGVSAMMMSACSNATLSLLELDHGLLGHWALDESHVGSPAVDSSGFGNDGLPSADPPVPVADVPPVHFPNPYSLSFNGQEQWISIGNPALLNLGGPVSVAAWLRASATDGLRDIVAHGYRLNPGFDLALRVNDGSYEFTMWDGATNHNVTAAMDPPQVARWVHLCGVYDNAGYRLYVDGTLVATRNDPAAPAANVDTDWTIAGRPSDRQFVGSIDDVRIYGRALAAEEVLALYQR